VREQGVARGSASEDQLLQQFLQWKDAAELAVQPAEKRAVEQSAAAAKPRAEPEALNITKPKRLLVVAKAPLADQSLADGGLITALVSNSLNRTESRAAGVSQFELRWATSALTQLQFLLGNDANDLSFPWESADCDRPNDLAPASALLCDNAIFSDPIMQIVIGLFTLSESAFKFDTDESIFGKTICLPQDRDLSDLNGHGRNWVLERRVNVMRQPSLAACLSAVQRQEADAFIASDLEGRYALGRLGLLPLFRMAERPLATRGVHAIVSRQHPQASALIDAINRGLAELKQSDLYSTLLRQHLGQKWDARASTP
jgi:hypothetical protein